MKNKLAKKIVALIMCGVMMFGGSSSALAYSSAETTDLSAVSTEQVSEAENEEITEAPEEENVVETPVEQSQTSETPVEQPKANEPTVVEKVVETVVEVVEIIIEYIIGMHDDLTYRDDKVIIKVYAEADEIIPEGTKIKVVPILQDDDETKEQYEKVAAQLNEKVESEEQTLQGFLAYDISLVDPEGNKFEPNGEVKVSIEYKKAMIPEEVTDVENTEVTVHHFEEDENGEVKEIVDMVAQETIETTVTVTEQVEIEKAEFTTTSFSTYTITWKNSNSLTVQVVDTEGTGIGSNSSTNITKAGKIADIAPEVTGYTFSKATLKSASGTEIKRLRYQYEAWQYSTSETGNNWSNISNSKVYFVYDRKPEGIKILDDIINTGELKAECVLNNENESVTKYEWYRSNSQNGTYTLVEEIEYQGGKSNLSEDGSKLYPAYDEGAQKWYKVKVTITDSSNANATRTMESEPLQVVYYNELKNGSFETPNVIEMGHTDTNNWQFSNEKYKKENGVWQTTGIEDASQWSDAEGADIEIVTTQDNINKAGYGWNPTLTFEAKDGIQFAELNCEAAGALYQDVLTMEGTALNYWLAHRARGVNANAVKEYDTMFLVIAPTKNVESITTQQQLETYLSELKVNYNTTDSQATDTIVYNNDGVLVVRITSDDQSWHTITKAAGYTPTASLTRFFFMSGKTASGNKTQGNFLDKVGFSQELPPVSDDEFTLQIEKKFEGLGNENIEAVRKTLQFNIKAVNKQTGIELTEAQTAALFGVSTISGSDMTLKVDGSLVYTLANKKIGVNDQYDVTITETGADLSGYSLKITTQTKVAKGEVTPTETATSKIESLEGKVSATVIFTNKYEAANFKNIHFTKVWDDNNNKWNTRPESLEVTLKASITVEDNGGAVEKQLDDYTQTATLNEANEWKCSWKVPVYHVLENGVKVKIQYKVVEGTINSDYVYVSPSGGVSVVGDGSGCTPSNFDSVKTTGDVTTGKAKARAYSMRSSSTLSTTASETTSSGLGDPAHNKYIAYNESTAEYTLNLDVTGAKGSAKGVDVLFVIDTSGSMGSGQGSTYTNLLPEVKTLLTQKDGIIDKIFAKEGNVNSVAYVSFAGVNETKTSSWYQTNTKETLKSQINKLNATGGTNWTYAMKKASDLLSQKSNSSNEKVVIFLSDGKPTYSYKNNSQTGNGSETKDSYYTDAASVVNNSNSLKAAKLYSVYLTNGTKSGMETFSDKVSNSELVDGTSLSTALTTILNKVIPTYKNVTITDTLSEYVEFVESVPTITVTKKTAAGVVTTLTANQDYTATVTGKTVTVNLLNGASLEDGATYTVSFKVKPSEAANNKYAAGGYIHTGEAGTGITSAGKAGFYSNVDEKTKVSYEIDGTNEKGSATYPMPVVQVTTHKLSYTKIWNKPEGISTPTEPVILNVVYTDGTTKQITLTSPNYTYEETVPVTKKIASITEQEVADYTPSYNISSDGTNATITNSYSKVTSTSIKVVKKWEGNGPKTPIRVSLWQSSGNGSATRYGEVVTLQEGSWEYTWKNLPQSSGSGSELVTYTYAVREENIPTNYVSNITYNYGSELTTATITNGYDTNCADESYYIENVLQTEQWNMNKVWDDDIDTSTRPDSVNVTVNGMTFELDETNGWTKSVTVLKKKNVSYTATETFESDNYEQAEKILDRTDAGMSVTFVNRLKTTSITVKKEWNDNDITDRPKNIQFKLLYSKDGINWYPYGDGTYSMTEEDMAAGKPWSVVFDNLAAIYQYKVEELNAGSSAYVSSVSKDTSGTEYTITNTLKWSAKKVNAQWSSEAIVGLKGAEFELKKGQTVIATGTSGTDGIIEWSADVTKLDGTYIIIETKAPEGYMIRETGWEVVFENGLLKTVDKKAVSGDAENGVVIQLENTAAYELPSTGGFGIYVPMMSGVILMMAAAMIFMKNKRREVL